MSSLLSLVSFGNGTHGEMVDASDSICHTYRDIRPPYTLVRYFPYMAYMPYLVGILVSAHI